MSNHAVSSGIPEMSPHEVAAKWFLQSETGALGHAERARLEAWLADDPHHQAAWDDVAAALRTVADNAADKEFLAMRSRALAARPERRWPLSRMTAVAGLLIIALTSVLIFREVYPGLSHRNGIAVAGPARGLYRTTIGGRAEVTLPDGSVAVLDTDSAMRIAYTDKERGIRLLKGQALFVVAKHQPAPFRVYAGSQRVTAVGTRFNVRVESEGRSPKTSVALIEGVVRVAGLNSAGSTMPDRRTGEITMRAGEIFDSARLGALRISASEAEGAASWVSGTLSFDDMPLGQAVAEMNRYTARPIGVGDRGIANLRVSGVFKTGDSQHFAESMAEVFHLRVTHDERGNPLLLPRPE